MIGTGRTRATVLVLAVLAAIVVVGGRAEARVRPGAPEAVASPYTRTDPTGDCVSGQGPGGSRCDLVKLKVVNGATTVRLVATYAGTPYLPVTLGTSRVGTLTWHLEGTADFRINIQNIEGTLYTDVLNEAGDQAFCWSGTTPSAAPVVNGNAVTVTVPRSCLPELGDVRVYAQAEKVKPPSAAVAVDRAPNTGFTPRVAQVPA